MWVGGRGLNFFNKLWAPGLWSWQAGAEGRVGAADQGPAGQGAGDLLGQHPPLTPHQLGRVSAALTLRQGGVCRGEGGGGIRAQAMPRQPGGPAAW